MSDMYGYLTLHLFLFHMRHLPSILLFASFISLTIFSSCVSSKKTSTSTASVEKKGKKNVETSKSEEKKTATEEKTVTTKKEVNPSTMANIDEVVSTPPIKVNESFKKMQPAAKEVLWTKMKSSTNYKVDFILDENNESITFSENGDWTETRTQILPDQLPHNIYNAIKEKYPDVFVVSAASIKNVNTKASYSAVLRKETETFAFEVILTDQGVFLE